MIAHREAGRIRHFGLSNWAPERLRKAIAYAKTLGKEGPVAIEPFWGLAEPERAVAAKQGYVNYYEDGYRPLHAEGLAVTPYSGQSRGFFTKLAKGDVPDNLAAVYMNDANKQRLVVLQEIAKAKGADINHIVLSYLLSQPEQTIPIIGCKSVAQLEESLGALDYPLNANELERLRRPG
jgi:aryl-alcohol dehydrogenase-like predicted oxidoreductase